MEIDRGFDELANQLELNRRSIHRGKIQATDGVIPLFHWRDVEDKPASREAGRVIMKQEAYIEIIVPGSKDCQIAPVNEQHKARFPEQWESFESGDDHEQIIGTPVTEWQGVSRTRAMELRANGFYTVELIAQCSDAKLKALGNQPSALREQAQQYISQTDALAYSKAENQKLLDQIAALTAKVEELSSGNDKDNPPERSRRRRRQYSE